VRPVRSILKESVSRFALMAREGARARAPSIHGAFNFKWPKPLAPGDEPEIIVGW